MMDKFTIIPSQAFEEEWSGHVNAAIELALPTPMLSVFEI
jgi:hypothetical protein